MIYKICFIILFTSILFSSCHDTPTEITQTELREDLSKSEFKEAIIGKWKSIFETPEKATVERIELDSQQNAIVVIKHNENSDEYKGTYQLTFFRPPEKGNVTLAEITIEAPERTISLNFGLHSALPVDSGYLLRIDEEPFGVLQKM
jgi:hypothetical protein